MKKLIFLLIAITCLSAVIGCKGSHKDYVNLWPGFSMQYPKDWEEKPAMQGLLRITPPKATMMTGMTMQVMPNNKKEELKNAGKIFKDQLTMFGEDIKILSDKEIKLNDGTTAQEVEIEFWVKSGPQLNTYYVIVPKNDIWIVANILDDKKISDDFKKIPLSIKLNKEEVKLIAIPDDIQKFFDRLSNAMISRNEEKIFACYSEKFMDNGMKKEDLIKFSKMNNTNMGNMPKMTGFKYNVVKMEVKDNVTHINGFSESDTMGKMPMDLYIMKEESEWKLFGNQKERMM
jgi:hypothetical protein